MMKAINGLSTKNPIQVFFSARSGEINDDQKSELSIMMNVLMREKFHFGRRFHLSKIVVIF